MKNRCFPILLILFLVSTFYLPNTFAQGFTQLGLPDGAIGRLGRGGGVTAVAYSPDGRTLASASSGKVDLWDAATGEHRLTLTDGGRSVVYSSDGRTLSSGGTLWDAETGHRKLTLAGSSGYVNSVVYAPDGRTLAGGGYNGIRIWDAETGRSKLTLDRPVPGIRSVVYSPDGGQLAVGNNLGIWLYDLRLGTEVGLLRGHTREVLSVAYSPDGQTLASAGGYFDNTVRLWDVATGKLKQTLSDHIGEVTSVLYSPDGCTLASVGGYVDQTIRLWDAKTEEHKHTLAGHLDDVYSAAFSPDGNTLASGSRDETILLWDIAPYSNTNGFVSISPSTVQSPAPGSQLIFSLDISDGNAVVSYQTTIQFDPTALRYVSGENGDYLPSSAFVERENTVTLVAASLTGESNGDGTLATLTFEVVGVKDSTLKLSKALITDSTGESLCPRIQNGQITEPQGPDGDVSGDGIVNIQDLVLVASNFGKIGKNVADVNGDGIVNIVDLTLVAGAMSSATAAPVLSDRNLEITLTRAEIYQWLYEAQQVNLINPTFQRGILVLEQLLTSVIPKETVLLPNYPNPFNPETWIPYQLAEPADVFVSIYTADGKLVRTLDLGHRSVGIYEARSHAAYWDGRNELGEPMASGVYFYTLTAGDFTATRKMLILK